MGADRAITDSASVPSPPARRRCTERDLTAVYAELRRIAARLLGAERPGHTLQPTALVHEAYLRLAGDPRLRIDGPGHLVGLAARSMRQILVNHALSRRAAKRGGGARRVRLDPALELFESRCGDLVALDEALDTLARDEERLARVVELRFFGGLSVAEVAALLDRSERTVERDWSAARERLRALMEAS